MTYVRFFLGKNKVMKVALGRTPEDEYAENLHKIGANISGNTGLLMTNKDRKEVEEYFNSIKIEDYARSGFTATETVTIPAGPQEQFVGSMIESLRQLGLPVQLKRSIIHVIEDYTICKKGEVLTPEKAKLLVHFEKKMANFCINLVSHWSDGKFNAYEESDPAMELEA